MSEQTAEPLTIDSAIPVTEGLRKKLLDQQKDIESTGVLVTRVQIENADSPPKFTIRFVVPIYEARLKLEAKQYDVGQRIGEKDLSFYATKRTEQGEGWSR